MAGHYSKGLFAQRKGEIEMNLRVALIQAAKLYQRKAEKFPNKKVNVGDESLSYAQISAELYKVADWAYPAFETAQLQKVTRCQECDFYVTMRKRGTKITKHICQKDGAEKSQNHFCAYAKERKMES